MRNRVKKKYMNTISSSSDNADHATTTHQSESGTNLLAKRGEVGQICLSSTSVQHEWWKADLADLPELHEEVTQTIRLYAWRHVAPGGATDLYPTL